MNAPEASNHSLYLIKLSLRIAGKYAPTETLSISAYYREEKEGGKREVQRGSLVHKRSPESPKIDPRTTKISSLPMNREAAS